MIIILFTIAITILSCLLVVAGWRIEHLQSELLVPRIDQATLVEAVGNKHEANVLRLAALAYDSPQEQHHVKMLSRFPVPSGRSVIARWLNERADQAEARNG